MVPSLECDADEISCELKSFLVHQIPKPLAGAGATIRIAMAARTSHIEIESERHGTFECSDAPEDS